MPDYLPSTAIRRMPRCKAMVSLGKSQRCAKWIWGRHPADGFCWAHHPQGRALTYPGPPAPILDAQPQARTTDGLRAAALKTLRAPAATDLERLRATDTEILEGLAWAALAVLLERGSGA